MFERTRERKGASSCSAGEEGIDGLHPSVSKRRHHSLGLAYAGQRRTGQGSAGQRFVGRKGVKAASSKRQLVAARAVLRLCGVTCEGGSSTRQRTGGGSSRFGARSALACIGEEAALHARPPPAARTRPLYRFPRVGRLVPL